MTDEQLARKHRYLNKYIFFELKKNPDIENSSMVSFDAADFSIVLERVQANSLGIYGIEASLDGEFYAIKTHEEYSTFPQDVEWFTAAFKSFMELQLDLKYSASYYLGGNLL
ncbi:hypothetical protein [Pedobacter sp. CFBP9032]|uniref:hypothetical protein n=1 Tax=Pedobacter sp. CFBP9032 TaxID=3096539 RepID=UPI002A69DFA8|nr:hypothetical protein [Pedobacter sp. CFBP9032]MDY0905631.1 hypothetical protein [Pedobacter sp. CFBP9032]